MKPVGAEAEIRRRASRPARGAWIETHVSAADMPAAKVAPRAGRVD